MNVSQIIKEKRDEQNLTFYELEKRCGVSRMHISRIEKGLMCPSFDNTEKILNTLGYELTIKKK